MASIPIDQPQREHLINDLDTSFCVEAAAGTGKTSLLVRRILSIVASGRAELEQVVAITFTEKAAGELKVRLREELEKALANASEGQRDRLGLGLEQLDRANISTIHSFASTLLRERPVEAGVDPAFDQLDEMGSDLLFEDVWQKWKEEQFHAAPDILRRLVNLELSVDKAIKPLARQLFENRDIALIARTPRVDFDLDGFWTELEDAVQRLLRLSHSCTSTDDRGYLQIRRLRALVEMGRRGDRWDREKTIFLDLDVSATRGRQNNWDRPDACRAQKEICKNLKGSVEFARERLGQATALEILEWLKGFLQLVEKEKQSRGVLDFQDLLLKARNLVRDQREVRAYFQDCFRFLLVDEFQDTDPLQAELIFFLAEERPLATCWLDVKPAPGKLFLVGDPKQSIYRFRRADIEIYKQAKEVLSKSGEAVVITQNFRSSGSVIRNVNQLFESQMGGRYQADYVSLFELPGRPDPGPGVVLLYPPREYQPGNMDAYREAEADVITRFIQKAATECRALDRTTGFVREASYRDIAMLFPVTTSITSYHDSLARAGIPYRFDSGRQFYERAETRALLSVLKAVESPENAVAVVAALRSPFFGLSDEDIFLYKQAGGSFNYLRRFKTDHSRVCESLEQLREWNRSVSRLSMTALIEQILDDCYILPFHLLFPNGEQAVANLLRIVELGRAFEAQTAASLRGFVRWLEQREASELAEAEGVLAEEKNDAVQLMTVHAAKGLEFPIVILANFGCQSKPRHPFLVDHVRQTVGVSLGSTGLHTPNHSEMEAIDVERAEAENLRLLYVATTRARDTLAIPMVEPERTSKARFIRYFSSLKSDPPEGPEPVEEEGRLLMPAEALPLPAAGETVLRRNISLAPLSPESVAPILEERQRWRDSLQQLGVATPKPPTAEESEDWKLGPESALRRGGGKAKAMGTAFHRVMQHVQLDADPMLDRIIEQTAAAEGIGSDVDALGEIVYRTLAHPLLERARRAKRIWRELPFSLELNGHVREGYIDLLFEEEDGLVLVDYKTDEVDAKSIDVAAERYRDQAELYQTAVQTLGRQAPKEFFFLFVRPGLATSIPVLMGLR